MTLQVKALLFLGGLTLISAPLFGQSSEVVHLDEVELHVYDLKAAFERSIKTASESFEDHRIKTYSYQEHIDQNGLQSVLSRIFELEYSSKGQFLDTEMFKWSMLEEHIAHCKSNELPYPDMAFLNQTLQLKFYQRLFLQFVDRLVITQEVKGGEKISLKLLSKALGAIDKLSARFEIDTKTKHIDRIILSLLIDPNYELSTQQWQTRTLFIDISFQEGVATKYEAHTVLHSRQRQILDPLIFRQRMQAVHFIKQKDRNRFPVLVDLNKALKPPCEL